MLGLLVVLGSLALLDSLTVLPLAIPLQLAFLSSSRPHAACAAFMAGLVAVYLPIGVALALGLDAILDRVEPALQALIHHPGTIDLVLQLALGTAMLVFGWKLARSREGEEDDAGGAGVSPGGAFAMGAGAMLVGLPGALPYFAAVDQILRFDVDGVAAVGALFYYNAVFLAPVAALPLLRALLGERVDPLFERLAPRVKRGGHWLIVAILGTLGAVAVVDAIGWLLGRPVLPLPPAPPA